MRRWKRLEKRLNWLQGDHLELSFCTRCWATVWLPHKKLHQQWHDVKDYADDLDRGPDEVTDSLYGGDGSGDFGGER